MTILYVESAPASAAFYEALLGHAPAEASPGFAMFPLPSGGALGLWTRAGVSPAAEGRGGGELVFPAEDVDAAHAEWRARGITILQPPADAEFGRNFVAADPDGHRLRVMAPPA
ncbi:VOC family protein [Roseomonas sp. CCTCC AB2023176]|uniref:VOC family protein n=1 Tax=Roseomonas sp. CCTCC AB2023176 TaxID=3342640 RepID=UPI0035DD9EEE